MQNINFIHYNPDKNNNWINQTDNNFDSLLPLVSKKPILDLDHSIFLLSSLGVLTNRDEWVYDYSYQNLVKKMLFFNEIYNQSVKNNIVDYSIKWSSSLEMYWKSKIQVEHDPNLIRTTLYRPFCKQFHYTEKIFNHRLTRNHYEILGKNLDQENYCIVFNTISSPKSFHVLVSNCLVDGHLTGDSQCLPLYSYDKEGNHIDNITDWGLTQFQTYYNDKSIQKIDIFHYTYAVLHNPIYQQKYEQNLKRDFPRIPFYDNFPQWVTWENN